MLDFIEYIGIVLNADTDLTELENHLSMNGYDFGIDIKRRVLFVCSDEIDYVETILSDRNITYDVKTY